MEELIDVLDKEGNKTGEVLPKSEVKKNGLYHGAIAVCIVNDNNEILMQKRSPNKRVYPNLWSIFVKGHIESGESSIEACQREVKEELGIHINEDELEYLYTILEETSTASDYVERIFFDTYLLRKNIKLNEIIIQEEELSDIKLLPLNELKTLVEDNSEVLVPNQKDYEKIFLWIQE